MVSAVSTLDSFVLYQHWKKSAWVRGPSGVATNRERFPNRLASQCTHALSLVARLLRYGKAILMATKYLSAPALFEHAHIRLQAGDIAGSGCYCRAGLTRWLHELCKANDCMPPLAYGPTPWDYIEALQRAGVLGTPRRRVIRRLINTSNRAALVLAGVTMSRMRGVIESTRPIVEGGAV